LFWYAEFNRQLVGVAFGAFADPSISWRLTKSSWEATGHPWAVSITHSIVSEASSTKL
jgi:hypothetical protein